MLRRDESQVYAMYKRGGCGQRQEEEKVRSLCKVRAGAEAVAEADDGLQERTSVSLTA